MTLVVSPSAIEVITRPIPWFNTYKLHAVGEFTYEHLRQSQSYDKLACIREKCREVTAYPVEWLNSPVLLSEDI